MNEYKFNLNESTQLSEQEETQENDRISEIIAILRDEDFTNIKQRLKFAHLILELIASSNDPRVRRVIRKIGDLMTQLGEDELNGEPEEELEVEEPVELVADAEDEYDLGGEIV